MKGSAGTSSGRVLSRKDIKKEIIIADPPSNAEGSFCFYFLPFHHCLVCLCAIFTPSNSLLSVVFMLFRIQAIYTGRLRNLGRQVMYQRHLGLLDSHHSFILVLQLLFRPKIPVWPRLYTKHSTITMVALAMGTGGISMYWRTLIRRTHQRFVFAYLITYFVGEMWVFHSLI